MQLDGLMYAVDPEARWQHHMSDHMTIAAKLLNSTIVAARKLQPRDSLRRGLSGRM